MASETLNMFEEMKSEWIRVSRMSPSCYTVNFSSYGLIYRARSASKLKDIDLAHIVPWDCHCFQNIDSFVLRNMSVAAY